MRLVILKTDRTFFLKLWKMLCGQGIAHKVIHETDRWTIIIPPAPKSP